jgi:hypothetical protein
LVVIANAGYGQQAKRTDTLISAGPEYKTSSFHQWLWGKNYRAEWATPIPLPIVRLDTLKGGLTVKKAGGGHQTKSLQLQTSGGQVYAIRSVNKTLGKVLPKAFLNTFIEDIVNDKVSMSHPYGAAGVPGMAKAANIYHTNPAFYYIPQQKALDTFSEKYGNNVYLFEQKVDGNWEGASNLGNFEKYISTDKLLEKLYDDNDISVNQKVFVKERLFDMFINDWDRHEDQWEWGQTEKKGKTVYTPVPQDRDQAFFKRNGVLLNFLIGASGMNYFQPLKEDLPDVKTFNFEQRNLDRFFLNQLTLDDWVSAAKELQDALTDIVIEASVRKLPADIFPISGNDIISKLKARRGHLQEYATTYYNFIAKEVDIVGSKKNERFEIKRVADGTTHVNIFKITKEGEVKNEPIYSRTFKDDETNEIRLYGLSGKDQFAVTGDGSNKIKIRLIGGDEKDSIVVAGTGKVHVYDNSDNNFSGSNARLHLSNDTSIHRFEYKSYVYDKSGISPIFSYSNEDRWYVGLHYNKTKHAWRKEPFASKQKFGVNYSLAERAPSVIYKGLFPSLVGKWDLSLLGNYDAIRWVNFFGLGNDTKFLGDDINVYRARIRMWIGKAGLTRRFGKQTITVNGLFESMKVKDDTTRYISKSILPRNPDVINSKDFAGGEVLYSVHHLNDSVVPTSGILFKASAAYRQNLKETNRNVARFAGELQLYVPLIDKFSLFIRTGVITVTGNPEFYQYASIGGGQNLRGYRRDRFWGQTAFYNSNGLRYIKNVHSYLYNGKAGLIAFIDNGRVWLPNEKSDDWHVGYGGGIVLAPFNFVMGEITYSMSKEDQVVQLRLLKLF